MGHPTPNLCPSSILLESRKPEGRTRGIFLPKSRRKILARSPLRLCYSNCGPQITASPTTSELNKMQYPWPCLIPIQHFGTISGWCLYRADFEKHYSNDVFLCLFSQKLVTRLSPDGREDGKVIFVQPLYWKEKRASEVGNTCWADNSQSLPWYFSRDRVVQNAMLPTVHCDSLSSYSLWKLSRECSTGLTSSIFNGRLRL